MKKYVKSDYIGHNFGTGGPKYAIYVFDGDDNKWKTWGGWYRSLDEFDADAFLDKINHPNFPNPEFNYARNYLDVKIIPNGEDISDYVESSTSIECSEYTSENPLLVECPRGSYYVWEEFGEFKGSVNNPNSRIVDARRIQTFDGFDTIDEVIDYVQKYF